MPPHRRVLQLHRGNLLGHDQDGLQRRLNYYKGDNTTCTSNNGLSYGGNFNSDPALAIPDNTPAGVNDVITVPTASGVTICQMKVHVTIPDHTFIGDLIVTLAPQRRHAGCALEQSVRRQRRVGHHLQGRLARRGLRLADHRNLRPFAALAGFTGSTSDAAWTLNVSDNAGLDTGTLTHWDLQFATCVTLNNCCIADIDDGSNTGTRDGGVGIEDLLYFLARYDAGDLAADVDDGNGNGPDGGIGIEDLLFYLSHYDGGC